MAKAIGPKEAQRAHLRTRKFEAQEAKKSAPVDLMGALIETFGPRMLEHMNTLAEIRAEIAAKKPVKPKSQKLQEARQAVESVSQRSITVADIRKTSKLAKASSIAPIELEDGSRAYLADKEQIAKSVEGTIQRAAVINVIKPAQSNKDRQAKWRAANPDKNRQRARDGMRKKSGQA